MAADVRDSVIVVVCALEREAKALRRGLRRNPQVEIQVSGMGWAAARQAAEQRLQRRPLPRLVVVAGFCGALRPHLQVGDIVRDAQVLTVPQVLATAEHKQLWASRTNALAVDMESAAVTEVCQRYGVACRVIRSVSDTWDQSLPQELLDCFRDQRLRVFPLLRHVGRRPALLRELLRLERQSRRAARTLAQAVQECVQQTLFPCRQMPSSHSA